MDDDTTLADWGTEMHLAKEDPLRAADPWRSWMEPHRERLWPTGLGIHEQPVSYDCLTGKLALWTPEDGDKDAWKRRQPASCVTGTTDWWGHLPAGEPWVDDLKTGYMLPGLTTPQMLGYALCRSLAADFPTCRISITHWRRGWDEPDRRWLQVGPATLDAFRDELHAAYRRAAAGPDATAGDHCRYCPSAMVCPTVNGAETDK